MCRQISAPPLTRRPKTAVVTNPIKPRPTAVRRAGGIFTIASAVGIVARIAARAIARLQSIVGVARDRDGARRGCAVRVIGVIVRPAGHGEPELARQREVALRRFRVVLGVVGLDRVEARYGEHRNPRVAAQQARMRERRDAAGLVNPREHLRGQRRLARHVRRPAAGQPLVERLADVGDVPVLDQRARDPRPPDRFRRVVDARAAGSRRRRARCRIAPAGRSSGARDRCGGGAGPPETSTTPATARR